MTTKTNPCESPYHGQPDHVVCWYAEEAADLTSARADIRRLRSERDELLAENERLQAALERVLDSLPEFAKWDAEPLREHVREALG